MQQRAGRCQPQLVRTAMAECVAREDQCIVQRAAPDVAAVHQAQRQHARVGQGAQHRLELFGCAHQIHMQAFDRQRSGERQVVVQRTEVGGQQDVRARHLGQHRVGTHEGGARGVVQVLHQHRLIQLHPAGAQLLQFTQKLHVCTQQVVEQVQRVAAIGGLGQQQETDRAQQHRPRIDAQCAGFAVLGLRLVTTQFEHLIALQLGHQVVVIGVEPLGHLQRMQIHAIALQATGHGEVGIQRRMCGQLPIALRNRIEQHGGVEHVVVQAEVVARWHIHAGITLQLPVACA
ncbi:hypothetical protein D3C81_875660 [compost metagenome]